MTTPDFDTAYDFILPLYSPFNLGFISGNKLHFRLELEDNTSGYRRVFAEHIATYARSPEGNEEANPLLEHPELYKKLSSLVISLSLWDLVLPYLGHYANVSKLILELDSPTSLPVLPRKSALAFQCIESLVLQARTGLDFVSAQALVEFVDQTIQAPQCRALELELVWFDGSHDAALERFDSISYSPVIHARRPITRKPIN